MCVCVLGVVFCRRDIYRKAPVLLTDLHTVCVCTLARRWSGQKNHLFTEGETSVRVCMHVRVCVFSEGVTGAQVSERASVRCSNLHTYTQTHVLLHPTGTGSGVCVCAYDS